MIHRSQQDPYCELLMNEDIHTRVIRDLIPRASRFVWIMTADINAWDEEPERYWRNAPTEVGKAVSGLIRPFYSGREQLQRDEAMRSIGMAMQTLMLMARDMGYDSCPMIGFDLEAVSELINLPEGHCIGPMISIGKRTQDAWPKPGQLPLESVLVENTFPPHA